MVDVEFVIEELAESLTLRAPPDFLLAATGERSECFLVEHSLPNLENCTVYPGQTSDKTSPIIVLDFSNPLEPQTSYTTKQDWYYMRFWVQHPENCSGGKTADGRCLGLVGEREWTLSLKLSEPNSLWEEVKGWGENCLPLFQKCRHFVVELPPKMSWLYYEEVYCFFQAPGLCLRVASDQIDSIVSGPLLGLVSVRGWR